MVLKVTEDVQHECLKCHLNRINISVPAPWVLSIRSTSCSQGLSTLVKDDLPPKTTEPASASADYIGTKSYRDAATSGLRPKNSAGAVTDGFTIATYEKKPAARSVSVNPVKHCRQPLIGVRYSASLPIVSKKEMYEAILFPVLNQRSGALI
jgi:hypothetical protein